MSAEQIYNLLYFQLPLSGSRDLLVVFLKMVPSELNFQLPLSGSQIAELFNHEGLRAPELSTPSLGITVFKPFVQNVLRFILLSTPSLGITYWCHGCPGFGSSGRAFQLPLSGSLTCKKSSNRFGDILYCFQLPLSGSRGSSVWFDYYVYGTDFQLPLSGSQNGYCLLRDCSAGTAAFQLPLSGSLVADQPQCRHNLRIQIAFNSLSRDHNNSIYIPY